ncbi:uncharacterized protein K489DRAFT_411480 [Dissoconium aciculare CBS 342.82]|uniref:Uncharacterized protein n=1 Tax=Dissoconium aciculare CBS 342.82 TaxID=1314786 RepID=A0A6J3LZJ8_9PEZI|nr:uncharacterized protein K489DRAFT_411480 [Dissoconium aciculare CBS 342.82]KAF1821078.1 hypothetical protein K489DRAFT_411480 [Dissoconium aciculare CBS 342.82]
MPRQIAPPPSGESFTVRLSKPFSGTPTHVVEIIGEPNRPATVKITQKSGNSSSTEKSGDVPKDDVKELISLISAVRGFPSHPSKDVYGFDTKLDFNTFEIQWSNEDDDAAANEVTEIAAETKDEFKRVADSVEALSRTFAKDAAI